MAKVKIVLDADVLIHFSEAGKLSLLPSILNCEQGTGSVRRFFAKVDLFVFGIDSDYGYGLNGKVLQMVLA